MATRPQGFLTTAGATVSAVLGPDDVVTLAMADAFGNVYATSTNRFYAAADPALGWADHWTVFGGDGTAAGAQVSCVVDLDGSTTLFMVDDNGRVSTASDPSIGWSAVSPPPGPNATRGRPVTAVATPDGSVTVFVADESGRLWTAPRDPQQTWGAWASVAPQAPIITTPGGPVTAVVGPGDTVTLVVADPGGLVWIASGNSTAGWGDWTPVGARTGIRAAAGAAVAAVLAPDGVFTLVIADVNGEVRTASGNAAEGWGGPWSSVAGVTTAAGGAVSAALAPDGTLALFVASSDGDVVTAGRSPAGMWGGWTAVSPDTGSTTPGAPVSAVLASDGVFTLVIADASGVVRIASGSTAHGFTAWTVASQASTRPAAPVSAVLGADGIFTVFIADDGGVVRTTSSNLVVAPGSPTPGWGPWTGLPANVRTIPGAPVTAVAAPDGTITVFMADVAGGVWAAAGNPTLGWGAGWSTVAQGSTMPGATITAVVAEAGIITLVVADRVGAVYTASGNAAVGWGEWWPVSLQTASTTPGAPVTALPGPQEVITLFMADLSGGIVTASGGTAQGWGNGWSAVPQASANAGAPVTAVVGPQGAITLFVVDPAGQVVTSQRSNAASSWSAWSAVSPTTGMTTPGAPIAAVVSDDGFCSLFMVDAAGVTKVAWGSPPGEWAGWIAESPNGASAPGAPVTAILTGTISSKPVPDGAFTLFATDHNGDVATMSGNPALGWGQGWANLSAQAEVTVFNAPISAVLGADGVVTAFVAEPGGGVFTASGSIMTAPGVAGDGLGRWTSVSEGSTTPGGPVTAVADGGGTISVFLADPGGGVFTVWGSPSVGWGDWAPVSPASDVSTTPGAPISAVVTPGDVIVLFVADRTGSVWTTWGDRTEGWGNGWSSVSEGRTTPGAPVTAVLGLDGIITVFLADPGGGVYTAAGNQADGWSPWMAVQSLTGTTTPGAPVTAVLLPDGGFAVFMVDPVGGGVRTTSGSRTQGWLPWSTACEGIITAPGGRVTAVATNSNDIALFVADFVGAVWTASGSPSEGWPNLVSVAPGGTTTPGATITAVPGPGGTITLLLPVPDFVTLGWAAAG